MSASKNGATTQTGQKGGTPTNIRIRFKVYDDGQPAPKTKKRRARWLWLRST